jgi:hypothetical protein
MLNSPDEGYISPVRHLKQVVFPAPDVPSKAKHSPNSSPKDMFDTAWKSSYRFEILLTLTGKLSRVEF